MRKISVILIDLFIRDFSAPNAAIQIVRVDDPLLSLTTL